MNMNVAERQRECHSQLLSSHDARDLLNSVDAFLFDCDGLIPLTFNFNFHSSSLYTHIYFWISISIFVMCIKFTKNTAGFCFYRCDMEGWYTHRWSLTDIRYASLQGTHTHSFSFSNFFFLFLSQNFEFLIGFYFLFLYFFQGKKLVFVTNNSTKSRRQYAKKFQSLGISVSEVCFISNTFFSPKCTDFVIDLKLFFFLLQYLWSIC